MAALEQLTGTVSKVSEKGSFQIKEAGTWFRRSDYADPMPELPEVGQHVVLGLDAKQFVRTIELAGGLRVVEPSPGPEPATSRSRSASNAPNRETTITRLALLKAASHVAASRPTMDRAAMLELAAAMEAWVTR